MEEITTIEVNNERAEFDAVLQMAAGFWIAACLLRIVEQVLWHLPSSLGGGPFAAGFWQYLNALSAPAIVQSLGLLPLWLDVSFGTRGLLIMSGLAAICWALACLVFTSTPRKYASRFERWLAALALMAVCSGLILAFLYRFSTWGTIGELVYVQEPVLAFLLCLHLRVSFRHVNDRLLQSAIEPVMCLAAARLVTHLATLLRLDQSAAERVFLASRVTAAATGFALFCIMMRLVWITRREKSETA